MRFLLLSGGGWTWFCSFTDGLEACSKNWMISCTGGGSAENTTTSLQIPPKPRNSLLIAAMIINTFSLYHLYGQHCHLMGSNPKGYFVYAESNQINFSLFKLQVYLTTKTAFLHFHLFSLFCNNKVLVLVPTENNCCPFKSVSCCKNTCLLTLLLCTLNVFMSIFCYFCVHL